MKRTFKKGKGTTLFENTPISWKAMQGHEALLFRENCAANGEIISWPISLLSTNRSIVQETNNRLTH